MRKILLVVCICLSGQALWGQKINVDSLLNVVISRNKSAKSKAPPGLDSLINAFSMTKDPLVRSRLYGEISFGNAETTEKNMMYAANKLVTITRKQKNVNGEAMATALLGYTIYNSGNNADGVKVLFKALRLAEVTGDKSTIGGIYNLLGVCNSSISEGHRYYQKALQFSRASGDDRVVSIELGNLSYIYRAQHKPDSARYFMIKSLELAVKNNYEISLAFDLPELAAAESDAKAKLKFLSAAFNLPINRTSPELMEMAAGNIASYYRHSKQTDSALYYSRRAYNVSTNLLIGRRLEPSALLASLFKGRNADSALKYTEISYRLRDSMYNLDKIEHAHAIAIVEQQKQDEIAAQKAADQANLRLYVMVAAMVCLLLLVFVFWRNNSQNKKAKIQIQKALSELKATQRQLIQAEKMASLGELTAGIAHEIQNPLNFVNNFSEVSVELLSELKEEAEAGNDKDVLAIADDIAQNLQKINHHGRRADAIVKGMLEHSRVSTGERVPADIKALADEYLHLAYHGLRAKDKSFNAELVTDFAPGLPQINIIPQDIGRVLLNLFNNAFYATQQKRKADAGFKPEVALTISVNNNHLQIVVKDNGTGIPDNIKEKIMQPFFTTKPTGEGTGLGLSLSYDIIVKGHGGSITADSKEGEFTKFTILLPIEAG